MTKELPKVLHITNIAALYRSNLWARLLNNTEMDYHFVYGINPYSGIKTIDAAKPPFHEKKDRIHIIKNSWIKKKYLFWQSGVISKCLMTDAKMVVLLGEFNVLSNWIAALICKMRGIHLIFRGHGMYGNEKGLKLLLRKFYYQLADDHLVYERRGKKVMVENGFTKKSVHIIFNSLDYDVHKEQRRKLSGYSKNKVYNFFSNPNEPTLLFVGRLTKVKKLHLLLEAKAMLEKNNVEFNLLFVGDGPERKYLEGIAESTLKKESFHFYGACYDENVNAALISCADICVSPGNVGLTAIHCLSLGTPIITHNNHHNQMPESEAITDGKTGSFFLEDDVEDLARKIEEWLNFSKKNRAQVREDCYDIIDTYYNPAYQEKVIFNLLKRNPPLL